MIFSIKKVSFLIVIFAVIGCGRDSKSVDTAPQQKADAESNPIPLPLPTDPTALPTDLALHDEGIEFAGLSVEDILQKKYSKAELKCDYGSIMEIKFFDHDGKYSFSNTSSLGHGNAWTWDLLKDFRNRPQWIGSDDHHYSYGCGKLDHQVSIKNVDFMKISKEISLANGETGQVEKLRPFVLLDYEANYTHPDQLPINPQPYHHTIIDFRVDESPLDNNSTSQPYEVGKNIFVHLHQIKCRLATTLKPGRE